MRHSYSISFISVDQPFDLVAVSREEDAISRSLYDIME